ncbi:hypothetical protein [Pseudonocardia sp. GCM10023141]|uniref:hypothetical protein n=1 Tax=Pseudonocardia sp. GCM10023141 TaxID=3252653 RepID=UPI003610FC26
MAGRSIMRRLALLAGAALAVTGLQIGVAAPAQAAGELACTLWKDVPFKDVNDGFSNDRHMRVQGQTQKCSRNGGPWVAYARAHLRHISADTWSPQYGFRDLDLRLYHDNGCVGCEELWNSGPQPEPGIGKDYYTASVPMKAGQTYGVLVSINYRNPPAPSFYQAAHQAWKA